VFGSKFPVTAVESYWRVRLPRRGATSTLALANQTTAIKSYLPSLDYKIHRYVFRSGVVRSQKAIANL